MISSPEEALTAANTLAGFGICALLGFLYFQVKHLVVDFLWQPPYEWQNKGKYGHWGGIRHSLKHVLVSAPVVLAFLYLCTGFDPRGLPLVFMTLGLEFTIHYHMDWFKMWWNEKRGYACGTHCEFWRWMGIDQFVHQLTYLGIVGFWWFLCTSAAFSFFFDTPKLNILNF